MATVMAIRSDSDKAFLEELELKLKLMEDRGSRASFAFAQAVRSVLSAIEYNDDALLGSHLETAKQCFIDFAEERIAIYIKESKDVFRWCERHVKRISDGGISSSSPELDNIGESLQKLVQSQIKLLTDLQSGLISAFDDITLTGSGPLRNEINRWREIQDSYLKSWPWTSRKRKPVDKTMLAKAKEDRQHGDTGISVTDFIKRLNDSSCTPE